mgnify:CR=1 FL=1
MTVTISAMVCTATCQAIRFSHGLPIIPYLRSAVSLTEHFQEDRLRLAILDYLRRFCPGDSDTYRIVSSHFSMYREIAQLLQDSGLEKLRQINFFQSRTRGTDVCLIPS